MAMMEDAIQHRSGQGHVGEDRSPISERLIARDDRGASFVALADELKQPRCRRFVELDVSQFVDDEQLGIGKMPLLVSWYAVELRKPNLIEQILCAYKIRAMTVL